MKFVKIFVIGIIVLFIVGFGFLSFYDGPAIELDTAGQFEYDQIQPVKLNQFKKEKQYVSMSDGTKIATNIFMPLVAKNKKVPTIFIFTPYNRSIVLPDLAWWEKAAAKAFTGTWGPVFDGLPNRKTSAAPASDDRISSRMIESCCCC